MSANLVTQMPHSAQAREPRRVASPGSFPITEDTRVVQGGGLSSPLPSHRMPTKTGALAPALALLSCVLFCLNGELLQALQLRTPAEERHASPLLNLLLCHLGGIVFVPHFYNLDTSGAASVSTGLVSGVGTRMLGYLSARPRIAALLFALLLTGYNYAWLLSTRFVPVAVTNATFQVSVALVYAASVPLFGEPLEVSRVIGVALVLLGSMLASGIVGGSGITATPAMSAASMGVGLSLVAAFGVAVYQVMFRHLFGHLKHDVRFLAFFSAWIGIWHILVVAPLVWLADLVGIEALEFPSGFHVAIGTMVSAALASTVNILYLCIALWGTPMLLPCSSVFSVPLTVVLDAVFHGKAPGPHELMGHVMVVGAVVMILNLQSPSVWLGSPFQKGLSSNHLETAP